MLIELKRGQYVVSSHMLSVLNSVDLFTQLTDPASRAEAIAAINSYTRVPVLYDSGFSRIFTPILIQEPGEQHADCT